MESLFTYIIHVTCLLSLVWLFWAIALRQNTFFATNRWYFIGGIAFAFLLPCISLPQFATTHPMVQQTVTLFDQFSPPEYRTTKTSISANELIIFVIGGGILIFTCLFCIRLVSFFRLRQCTPWETIDETKVFLLQDKIKPFSFLGHIFLNPSMHSQTEISKIIAHEIFHIKQRHTIDLILTEVLVALCWFNPFAWLLRKAMRQNLEFLADRHVLNSGFDTVQYQYILVRTSATGKPGLSITHNFTFSNLKKRIIMMNKQPSSRFSFFKYLLLIPFFAFAWIGMHAGEVVKNQDVPKFSQEKIKDIDPKTIQSITVLKGKKATDLYGEEVADGVVVITLKTGEVKVLRPSKSDSNTIRILESNATAKDVKPVVVASGSQPKSESVRINPNASVSHINALYVVDGKVVDNMSNILPDNIESITILKEKAAIELYGEKAKDGVVLITTKK